MKKHLSMPLILASASDRRRELLEQAGYLFQIISPEDAEDAIQIAPSIHALAMFKAREKVYRAARMMPPMAPACILGADTIVSLGNEVFGKPLDRKDALRILSALSGTRHQVITGLCLGYISVVGQQPEIQMEAETTWVTMREIMATDREAYVASGEADGKAGAYAIQETGDQFVTRIEGSFSNVVGLPLELLERLLGNRLN